MPICHTALCWGGITWIPGQTRNSKPSPNDEQCAEVVSCGLLTGGEAVAAGVALQLLFAVFTVKVIFAGGAQVHWKRDKCITFSHWKFQDTRSSQCNLPHSKVFTRLDNHNTSAYTTVGLRNAETTSRA